MLARRRGGECERHGRHEEDERDPPSTPVWVWADPSPSGDRLSTGPPPRRGRCGDTRPSPPGRCAAPRRDRRAAAPCRSGAGTASGRSRAGSAAPHPPPLRRRRGAARGRTCGAARGSGARTAPSAIQLPQQGGVGRKRLQIDEQLGRIGRLHGAVPELLEASGPRLGRPAGSPGASMKSSAPARAASRGETRLEEVEELLGDDAPEAEGSEIGAEELDPTGAAGGLLELAEEQVSLLVRHGRVRPRRDRRPRGGCEAASARDARRIARGRRDRSCRPAAACISADCAALQGLEDAPLGVDGEPFVQPEVVRAGVRHQIAGPGVRELVGDHVHERICRRRGSKA